MSPKTADSRIDKALRDRMAEAVVRADGSAWTQQEIADAVREAMGVDADDPAVKIGQATVQSVMSGRSARSAYIPHIAHVLGVDAFWLATGCGEMRPTPSVKRTDDRSGISSAERQSLVDLAALIRKALDPALTSRQNSDLERAAARIRELHKAEGRKPPARHK